MKTAIIATGPDYNDYIGHEVYESPHIIVFDFEAGQYDVFRNPLAQGDQVQNKVDFILLLIKKEITDVLVQRCETDLKMLLGNHDISVTNSVTGQIGDVIGRLQRLSLEETQVVPII